MCVVSMVGDYFGETVPKKHPNFYEFITFGEASRTVSPPTREEFEALRKDVLEMKELLRRAKLYDETNGERDCQKEEKVALLKKIAEAVGVDLKDIL